MANGLTANGPKTTIGFWDGLSAKSRQGGFFFLCIPGTPCHSFTSPKTPYQPQPSVLLLAA